MLCIDLFTCIEYYTSLGSSSHDFFFFLNNFSHELSSSFTINILRYRVEIDYFKATILVKKNKHYNIF